MKKIKIIQCIGLVFVLLYVILVTLNLGFGLLEGKSTFIFSIIIVIVGFNLLFKGAIIKSASTLWFSLNLIFGAIFIIVLEITGGDIYQFYFVLGIIPILASLINLAILRTKIYTKVIILNVSLLIPILLIRFTKIGWLWVTIIGTITFILGIVICRNINLDKEQI